ncbi:MAG: DUF2845 domain-containing protein [Deltaproteobacteria bacterium]|nr:DUF2845 domain-containing protein [Deltaproteobacteria bacterium]
MANRNGFLTLFCVLFTLLFVASSAIAGDDCVRCPNTSKIICVNDSEFTLIEKCGSPYYVSEETKTFSSATVNYWGEGSARAVTKVYKYFHYNFGPNRFMLIFTVVDYKVISIKTAGYGFNP